MLSFKPNRLSADKIKLLIDCDKILSKTFERTLANALGLYLWMQSNNIWIFLSFFVVISAMTTAAHKKHSADEMVSSAECSSDDEDLEECETRQPGGLG